MHECPECGSNTITCRHCSWTWNPRDPNNLPDTCPRCRCDWTVPFKWSGNSKYGHGALDPTLKLRPVSFEELEKLKKRFKIKDEVQLRVETRIRKAMNEPKHKPNECPDDDVDEPKKHLKELSA